MCKPILLHPQEWALQPSKGQGGHEKGNTQRCDPGKRHLKGMMVVSEQIVSTAQRENMERVQTIRNLAKMNQDRVLNEGDSLLAGPKDGQKNGDGSQRHQWVTNHASEQRRFRVV